MKGLAARLETARPGGGAVSQSRRVWGWRGLPGAVSQSRGEVPCPPPAGTSRLRPPGKAPSAGREQRSRRTGDGGGGRKAGQPPSSALEGRGQWQRRPVGEHGAAELREARRARPCRDSRGLPIEANFKAASPARPASPGARGRRVCRCEDAPRRRAFPRPARQGIAAASPAVLCRAALAKRPAGEGPARGVLMRRRSRPARLPRRCPSAMPAK